MGDVFISADELSDQLARGAPVRVFDVRRHQAVEAASRFIPGTRWRDHMLTDQWLGGIEPGTPIVVTCMHGHNVSQIAGARLREQGAGARVLAGGIDGWLSQDLPSIGQSQLCAVDSPDPSVWVTRLGAGIDRMACAWLIRRFIDPDAVFHFVETEWVADVAHELGAIAFGTPDSPIKNDANLCFSDAFLCFFAIKDPALHQLAVIVRGAATGHHDTAPEAAGLSAVSLGTAARAEDDRQALQFALPVYDALYARLRLAAGGTS